jgi:hypothetical protein
LRWLLEAAGGASREGGGELAVSDPRWASVEAIVEAAEQLESRRASTVAIEPDVQGARVTLRRARAAALGSFLRTQPGVEATRMDWRAALDDLKAKTVEADARAGSTLLDINVRELLAAGWVWSNGYAGGIWVGWSHPEVREIRVSPVLCSDTMLKPPFHLDDAVREEMERQSAGAG